MRLHLIDGTFELYRAHYSKRPEHQDACGRDVKATVGFLVNLFALLRDRDEAVTHVAVAFDNPIESFRNDLFHGYKTGEDVPSEIAAQFDLVERAAGAAGVVVWSMDRWEADDALATAATRWRDAVEQVRILTPDKDLGQSVRGTHVVQVDRIRSRVLDEDAVRAARAPPASIPDYLALVGDDADGIPGIPRFGAKTVATLLGHYGHIEDIPRDATDWAVKVRGAARLAQILDEHRENAMAYRTLATLVEDVPLEESLEELEWKGAYREEYLALCDELVALRLRDRPPRWRD